MPITYVYGKEDAVPDNVPAGVYLATVKKSQEKPSKAGNNMIELLWVLENGFGIWDHLVDKDNCRWKSNMLLEATGNEPEDGKEVVLDADEMVGWTCNVRLILRDGKNEVDAYLPLNKKEKKKQKQDMPF